MRFEIKLALDTNNVQRLLVALRHPTFDIGTVDLKIARQYMESLKTFRTKHSGTLDFLQWWFIKQTVKGNTYFKEYVYCECVYLLDSKIVFILRAFLNSKSIHY